MTTAHQQERLFLRFDDVGGEDSILDSLLEIANRLELQCLLAVIPSRLTETRARQIAGSRCIVFQHGFRHKNCAPFGQPNDEFPQSLQQDQIARALQEGKTRLEHLLNRPITGYVPPWNFTSSSALRALEELGFETFSASQKHRFTTTMKTLPVGVDVNHRYHQPVIKQISLVLKEICNGPQNLDTKMAFS